ncbi:nucleotidyl transferase AbiEii/AbiGii toxin family protein [Rikenella microfusus]|uniref:nucleotidyl transferase AbiEii/AbiGii toxin family protein n=1 Tax=Rikenella microfusus TaxID=28139 RepID=UPI001DE6BC5A|nr:nucleotidyl transferase AbiEii/AbiGii toxin family protein [Rikenella microfusus]HJE87620.1 nucleotidyl transferase AbiEii/AbiGii toxin family protein [Rikenella microfusus]
MADKNRLHWETVTPLLKEVLGILMAEKIFAPFRLVGGTNLSLRYGHRLSADIDLFTDAGYGSLDYHIFEKFLREHFPFCECNDATSIVGFGRGYYIGNSADEYIKLDLMYTDPFLEDAETIDGVRMADVKDIIAMKMNVVSRGSRKKDFWDLHLLLQEYTLAEMFDLHVRRHEWEHDAEELLEKVTDFIEADALPDPVCLLGKEWDEIKLDLVDAADDYAKNRTSYH